MWREGRRRLSGTVLNANANKKQHPEFFSPIRRKNETEKFRKLCFLKINVRAETQNLKPRWGPSCFRHGCWCKPVQTNHLSASETQQIFKCARNAMTNSPCTIDKIEWIHQRKKIKHTVPQIVAIHKSSAFTMHGSSTQIKHGTTYGRSTQSVVPYMQALVSATRK